MWWYLLYENKNCLSYQIEKLVSNVMFIKWDCQILNDTKKKQQIKLVKNWSILKFHLKLREIINAIKYFDLLAGFNVLFPNKKLIKVEIKLVIK